MSMVVVKEVNGGIAVSRILLELVKEPGFLDDALPAAGVEIETTSSRQFVLGAALVDDVVDAVLLEERSQREARGAAADDGNLGRHFYLL